MDTNDRSTPDLDPSLCSGLRTFLVPPDIIPVKRQSPVKARKRTPWKPCPDGSATTDRCGGREWFGDGVFVESEDTRARAGFGTSLAVHATVGIALTLVLVTQGEPTKLIAVGSRKLVMPVSLAVVPAALVESPSKSKAPEAVISSAPVQAAETRPPAASPAAAAVEEKAGEPAPVVAPGSIAPESGLESGLPESAGGIEKGVPGGVPNGVPEGSLSPVAPTPGPLRVGGGIKTPRKLKDVKPVYPDEAVTGKAAGLVLVEAVIGTDGRIQDARILRSIPLLDQAALNAVRQWEYEPTVVNGERVAVIVTVIVSFSMQ